MLRSHDSTDNAGNTTQQSSINSGTSANIHIGWHGHRSNQEATNELTDILPLKFASVTDGVQSLEISADAKIDVTPSGIQDDPGYSPLCAYAHQSRSTRSAGNPGQPKLVDRCADGKPADWME